MGHHICRHWSPIYLRILFTRRRCHVIVISGATDVLPFTQESTYVTSHLSGMTVVRPCNAIHLHLLNYGSQQLFEALTQRFIWWIFNAKSSFGTEHCNNMLLAYDIIMSISFRLSSPAQNRTAGIHASRTITFSGVSLCSFAERFNEASLLLL